MSHLEQTLNHLVEQGRMPADLADEVREEYRNHHIDVRARLAELAAYAGAACAVVGMAVLGSQIWSDVTQVLRALIPALCACGLLFATWLLARRHPAPNTARARLAQVLGVCAAALGAVAVAVALAPPVLDDARPAQPALAFGSGLVIAIVASRLAPGFLTTLATGVLASATGLSAIGLLPLDTGGPGPAGLFLVLLGVTAALAVPDVLPPAWLTRLMGISAWVFGSLLLLMSHEEYDYIGQPQPVWTWLGRVAALGIVTIGSISFARGGDWSWAVGAAVGAAMLVGLWSATAVNAGVALLVAGLVLVSVAGLLALSRRGHPPPEPPAKMGS